MSKQVNNFNRQYAESLNPELIELGKQFLNDMGISIRSFELSSIEQDKAGTDWLINHAISIDFKCRYEYYEDCMWEIESSQITKKLGWGLDNSKNTDYILYMLEKFYLIDIRPARLYARTQLDNWIAKYGTRTVYNGDSKTTCIPLPWHELKQFIVTNSRTYRKLKPEEVEIDVEIEYDKFLNAMGYKQ